MQDFPLANSIFLAVALYGQYRPSCGGKKVFKPKVYLSNRHTLLALLANTSPFLINEVSGPISKDTSLPNKCSVRPLGKDTSLPYKCSV